MTVQQPLSLDARPRWTAEWSERDGKVVIIRPRPTWQGLRTVGAWIAFLLMPSRLRLDTTGSKVWRQLDGARTLAEVISEMEKHDATSDGELPQRVELFVRALVGQGFVGVD